MEDAFRADLYAFGVIITACVSAHHLFNVKFSLFIIVLGFFFSDSVKDISVDIWMANTFERYIFYFTKCSVNKCIVIVFQGFRFQFQIFANEI